MTGQGMDSLNCAASNRAQIAADMAELKKIGVRWIRIETAMTATSALPNPPSCPRPAGEFENLRAFTSAIAGIGAKPVLNILAWHYPPLMKAPYAAWLRRLVAAVPSVRVFELADEENLSAATESFKGANLDAYPYGWDFDAHDIASNDAIGRCPTNAAKLRNYSNAAKRYAAWLKDSYAIIKSRAPEATVMLGGLSSYQPACWLQMMGSLHAYETADAIGYHPYPRYGVTPDGAAATLSDLVSGMSGWKKPLPVWITEFGFSTNAQDIAHVDRESTKARYLTSEFRLLARTIATPIISYTARDSPLTSAQWKAQCPKNACPGGIGGFGLFEWRDDTLIVEPAAASP